MYIRTQTEETIVDTEKILSITAETATVYLNLIYEGYVVAGTYRSQERAKEVVGEIYALMDVQSRYDMPIV